ncbi:hypothetical protein BH18ACT5_BH18ACT5_10290 [soil metagenome]
MVSTMDDMENTKEQTASPPVTAPLVRPAAKRIISGAAAGVAERLGISATVIRTVWVILAFTGIGIPLYLLAWLLIPAEGEGQSIGEQWMGKLGTGQGWIGVILVVIAIAVLTPALPFVDGGVLIPTILLAGGILLYQQTTGRATTAKPERLTNVAPETTGPKRPIRPATPPSPLGQITIGATVIGLGILALIDRATPAIEAGPRHYFALAVTILGLGVLVGAFFGRARWLIPFGLLLIPVTAGAGIVEYGNTAREQTLRPTTFAELESVYELGVGELTIDLSELPWNGEAIEVAGSVGVGRLELILPPNVAIEAVTEVGIGASVNPSATEGGLGVEHNYTVGVGAGGTVTANLEVGIGEIEVLGTGESIEATSEDMVIVATSPAALAPAYEVDGDANLAVDLSKLNPVDDVFLDLLAEDGTISVVLPADVSYTIAAVSDSGSIEILDTTAEAGGIVNTESDLGGVAITINAWTDEGSISISQGERS